MRTTMHFILFGGALVLVFSANGVNHYATGQPTPVPTCDGAKVLDNVKCDAPDTVKANRDEAINCAVTTDPALCKNTIAYNFSSFGCSNPGVVTVTCPPNSPANAVCYGQICIDNITVATDCYVIKNCSIQDIPQTGGGTRSECTQILRSAPQKLIKTNYSAPNCVTQVIVPVPGPE